MAWNCFFNLVFRQNWIFFWNDENIVFSYFSVFVFLFTLFIRLYFSIKIKKKRKYFNYNFLLKCFVFYVSCPCFPLIHEETKFKYTTENVYQKQIPVFFFTVSYLIVYEIFVHFFWTTAKDKSPTRKRKKFPLIPTFPPLLCYNDRTSFLTYSFSSVH